VSKALSRTVIGDDIVIIRGNKVMLIEDLIQSVFCDFLGIELSTVVGEVIIGQFAVCLGKQAEGEEDKTQNN